VIYTLEAHNQSKFFQLVKVHLSDQPLEQALWDFTGKITSTETFSQYSQKNLHANLLPLENKRVF